MQVAGKQPQEDEDTDRQLLRALELLARRAERPGRSAQPVPARLQPEGRRLAAPAPPADQPGLAFLLVCPRNAAAAAAAGPAHRPAEAGHARPPCLQPLGRAGTPLTRLTFLDVSESEYEELPPQLGELPALCELRMDRCSRLCGGFGLNTSLTRIHAGSCPRIGMGEIAALPVLRALSLNHTALDVALKWAGLQVLSFLDRLEELSLAGSGLTQVPPLVGLLPRLSSLDLRWNKLRHGWHHLASATQLDSLYLSGCNLTSIPPELSCLVGKRALRLDANPLLRRAPAPCWQPLQALSRLTLLTLLGCNIHTVPEELHALHCFVDSACTHPFCWGAFSGKGLGFVMYVKVEG
ncbi:hypothetical protein ABPG75_000250 [Micractinium tetrahymenae]